MKCICPMGGERDCPPDCTPAHRKAHRAVVAEQMFRDGKMTMEQIATQLDVSQATITRDLGNLFTVNKSKPTKTASNPKGAGRPMGAKSSRQSTRGRATPKLDEARKVVRGKLEAKEPISPHKLEKVHDFSHVTVDMAIAAEQAYQQGRRDAIEDSITPEMLSLTAKQKFEAIIRQRERRLAAEFEQRVRAEATRRVEEIVLPDWKEKIERAHTLYDKRKGLMDKETFNIIRRALHPDSRHSISDKKLGEAFDTFMGLEKYLLDEKDSPTPFGEELPSSLAEWDKMRKPMKRKAASAGSVVRR